MTDRTTINVSKEAHRKAQEAKEDGETWSEYLLRSTDTDAVKKNPVPTIEVDGDSIMETIGEEIERLDETANTESDPVDYAEIESRMERVIERMLR